MPREETSNLESNLEAIEDPMVANVFPQLNDRDLAALSQTCRFFRDLTSEQRKQRQVNELIRRVVCGEEKEAKAMLESAPTLLLGTGRAFDYSRRTVQATPFQATLCAGDVEMCQMMMTIAKQHNMEGELQAQFEAIFPNGVESLAEQQQQNTFDFDPIVAAITNASDADHQAALNKENNGSALCQALDAFREQFAGLSREETVFNPTHLLTAFERYDQEFDQWWNFGQRDLFWRQVVGYVQCFLPACYAQAFAQGIYYIVEQNEVLKRNFTFRFNSFTTYLPCFDGRSGLGFDFVSLVGTLGDDASWRGLRRHEGEKGAGAPFQNYVSKKYQALAEIYSTAASAAI